MGRFNLTGYSESTSVKGRLSPARQHPQLPLSSLLISPDETWTLITSIIPPTLKTHSEAIPAIPMIPNTIKNSSSIITKLSSKNKLLDDLASICASASQLDISDTQNAAIEQAAVVRASNDATIAAKLEAEAKEIEEKSAALTSILARENKEKLSKEVASKAASYARQSKAVEESKQYLEIVERVKREIKPRLSKERDARSAFFEAKCVINTRIGQTQNSAGKLSQIAQAITATLALSRNSNPGLYSWLLDFTAKTLLLQAEKEVSVRIPLSYPLAHLTLLLSQSHPDLIVLLMGRLMKRCPYIIPTYVAKNEGESMEDWKKRSGYRLVGNELEKEGVYTERMAGLVAFFTALNTHTTLTTPHTGVEVAWVWISRFVNMNARVIGPLLVYTFMWVGGSVFLEVFGGQGRKLLRYMEDWLKGQLTGGKGVAHSVRLKLLLDEWIETGRVKGCLGREIDS